MAEIPTGWACPTCDNLKITAMLFNEQFSSKGYYCKNGHSWQDMGELKALNPRKLPVPQRQTIQQGHEEVKMSIPSDLKAQLLQKFGSPERLAATLSAVFRALSQEKCFIVGTEDVEKLTEHSGIEINNSAQLVGAFFALRKQLQEAIEKTPATPVVNGNGHADLGPGKIAIDVQSHMGKLTALANFRKESPAQVAEATVKLALDQGWA